MPLKRKWMTPGLAITWLLLLTGAALMLLPYVWMVCSSSKAYGEMLRLPFQFLPKRWSLDNYWEVLQKMNFGRYYGNTIYASVTTVAGQLFFNSLAAYAFACLEFPGRKTIFGVLLSLLMIPPQMTLVANFTFLSGIGWTNRFIALIIPGFISVYGIFFMRQFFMGTPRELLESAYIDGAGHFRIYWQMVLPLSRNALVAYGIFALLGQWNELLWPLTMTSSDRVRVLSLAIAALQGQNTTKFQLIMAASVLSTAPMILVFILGQKSLIEGIAVTGLKV
jgi:multiple sugar transport system permease protein